MQTGADPALGSSKWLAVMGLIIKDGEGKVPVAQMRKLFEQVVAQTPVLARNCNLAIREKDGQFDRYDNANTDNLWCGFALGLRFTERFQITANSD